MVNKVIVGACAGALLLVSGLSIAEEGFKYRKLKPADPPCLFLLDEDTGQPTGDPVNTPCVLGSQTVNPGDSVDADLREEFGQVQAVQGDDPVLRKRPGR